MNHDSMRRPLAGLLFSIGLLLACVAPAQAGMVTTDEVLRQSHVEVQREALQQAMQREEIRDRLQALGVSPAAAEQRVQRLTGPELARLHQRVGTLPAGGDLSLVELLLIILLIVLIV